MQTKLRISYLYKNRNYNVIGYSFTAYENGGSIELSGHPNEIMNLLLDETNDTLDFMLSEENN